MNCPGGVLKYFKEEYFSCELFKCSKLFNCLLGSFENSHSAHYTGKKKMKAFTL